MWLLLVAPPSSSKTELILALRRVPDTYFLSELTALSSSDTAMTPQELERLLADKDVLSNLQQQREIIIATYAERDQIIPHTVFSCELKHQIHREAW